MKAAIDKTPVSVSVASHETVFHHYKSGIMDSKDCGTKLNHVITAVGYGSENGKEYYIVRNSWGASWGDKGYIKIAIEEGEGICGIQMQSAYPSTTA